MIELTQSVLIGGAGAPQSPSRHEYEEVREESDWRSPIGELSLAEMNGSIIVPSGDGVSSWRKCCAFVGPGVLVSVGYMDPGL